MKPRLLITIYANPDYYPPTVYAVRILSKYFKIHILCRNMSEPFQQWPSEVAIERMGEYASARGKEASSAIAKLTEYAKFVARTRVLIRHMQPLSVYSYDPHALAASIVGRAGRRSTPLIFHAHELPETQNLSWRSLEGWVVRAALLGTKSADTVVFPEKNRARHWLTAARDPRTPIIVPNCPDRSYYSPPADWSETIAARYRAREVVYVGYAGAENGHLEGLRAIAMTGDGIRMRIIGGYRPEFGMKFNALARELGVTERVSLDGWLRQDELLARASAAGAGLSLHKAVSKGLEYQGSASNKLFEYAAMGLPVVVPDRKSYRDFLGDAEWVTYADIDEPESIARAITSIFADRERYVAMSRAARRAFEEQYNYERVFAPALERICALADNVSPERAKLVAEEPVNRAL
ncbi:glycosyltransferase family protein [Candidatus Binatus sp.]|uniref:glycosyltransferase family protein n=2 Tax=Candidatus Binatus sp. TaxID=2811406 RepID=UPI003C99411F